MLKSAYRHVSNWVSSFQSVPADIWRPIGPAAAGGFGSDLEFIAE
jgi:hypothetical protein